VFADGSPRTAIEHPTALGLHGPTYLWGRPTIISAIDVSDHIGWIDERTALQLIANRAIHTTVHILLR
jgi:hypothetical protein